MAIAKKGDCGRATPRVGTKGDPKPSRGGARGTGGGRGTGRRGR